MWKPQQMQELTLNTESFILFLNIYSFKHVYFLSYVKFLILNKSQASFYAFT